MACRERPHGLFNTSAWKAGENKSALGKWPFRVERDVLIMIALETLQRSSLAPLVGRAFTNGSTASLVFTLSLSAIYKS